MDIYGRSDKEHARISRVRAIAGRKGGVARWQGIEREPTVKVRVYASDAARLKQRGKTIARAVRALLEAGDAQ